MDASTELKKHIIPPLTTAQSLSHWQKMAISTCHAPQSGLNQLVDHTAALFFYLHHLIQSPLHADTKKNIADYLETLQKRYQGLDYSSDMTLAAHYIVCATVDDILRCMAIMIYNIYKNSIKVNLSKKNFISYLSVLASSLKNILIY